MSERLFAGDPGVAIEFGPISTVKAGIDATTIDGALLRIADPNGIESDWDATLFDAAVGAVSLRHVTDGIKTSLVGMYIGRAFLKVATAIVLFTEPFQFQAYPPRIHYPS